MEDYHGASAISVEPKWRIEGSLIRCSVLSNGMTGKQWLECFEHREIYVCKGTKEALLSSRFVPTLGVKTEVAIFRSTAIHSDECSTIEAHEMGHMKGLVPITEIETTCLLRGKFSNEELEEMGFWWIAVMHAPIQTSDGNLVSLCVDRYGDKEWISAHRAKDYDSWNAEGGFAYEVPPLR